MSVALDDTQQFGLPIHKHYYLHYSNKAGGGVGYQSSGISSEAKLYN